MKWILPGLLVFAVAGFAIMDRFDRLRTNPIVDRQGKSGVVYRDRLRESPGYNLRNDGASCLLFNNDGTAAGKFPGLNCQFSPRMGAFFGTTFIGPVSNAAGYDVNGRVLWMHPEYTHHDSFLDPVTDEFYVLNWHVLPFKGTTGYFSGIAGYDVSGKRIFNWQSEEHLEDLWAILPKIAQDKHSYDMGMNLHAVIKINSVSVFRGHPQAALHPEFRDGNLLISIRRGCELAILDRETGRIVWHHTVYKSTAGYIGEEFAAGAHSARIMKNGHILYAMTHYRMEVPNDLTTWSSAAVELDPVTHEEVWVYQSDPPKLFQMDTAGSVQELENGNILITAEKPGYAFEVTKSKRLVWQYFNTEIGDDGQPMPLYRVTRLPASTVEPFLNR